MVASILRIYVRSTVALVDLHPSVGRSKRLSTDVEPVGCRAGVNEE